MIAVFPNGDIVASTDKEAQALQLLIDGDYERDGEDPRRFRNLMAEEEKRGCSHCRGL